MNIVAVFEEKTPVITGVNSTTWFNNSTGGGVQDTRVKFYSSLGIAKCTLLLGEERLNEMLTVNNRLLEIRVGGSSSIALVSTKGDATAIPDDFLKGQSMYVGLQSAGTMYISIPAECVKDFATLIKSGQEIRITCTNCICGSNFTYNFNDNK